MYQVHFEYFNEEGSFESAFDISGSRASLTDCIGLVASGVQVKGRVAMSLWHHEGPETTVSMVSGARNLRAKLNQMFITYGMEI